LRDAALGRALPEDFTGVLVEAQDDPTDLVFFVGWGDVAVQAGLERLVASAGGDGGGNEEPVTPDDRRGVAEAGDGRLPLDVASSLHVPLDRRGGAGGDAAGVGAAEGGPVCVRRFVGARDCGDEERHTHAT
jgi:hypothetical protein